MTIRVLITDDHAMLRSGLRALLDHDPDIEVIGEAANGHEALAILQRKQVDVLVLDISMPGMSGEQVAAQVRERHPAIAIAILTMHEDQRYVTNFLRLGAKAFVLKKSSGGELSAGIRAAAAGERYIDSSMAGRMLASLIVPTTDDCEHEELTDREREVCRLLALGHTNGEIADLLEISPRTVESHRHKIMHKLGFDSRAQIVRYARDHAMLD